MTERPALQTPSWRRPLRVYVRFAARVASDPAILLRVYGFTAIMAAAFLAYTLIDPRLGRTAERLFGPAGQATATLAVLLMTLGLCARAFAAADAVARGRGLHALAGAQMLLVAVMWFASRDLALAPAAIWPLLGVAALFSYLGPAPHLPESSAYGSLLTLFGRSPTGLPPRADRPPRAVMGMKSRDVVLRDVEGLRSWYERQIREAARQEERHRLARDLHDAVKQQIFVVQTAAATAQARFDRDPPGARTALDDIRQSARAAMTELEAMLDQLQAAPLEPTGLTDALRKQCEALGFRTGADVNFRVGALPPADALPPGAAQALLRVAQEALANVGRHARARHVHVSLDWTGHGIALTVRDDGTGFSLEPARLGMGMANMGARAAEFGGALEVVSEPGAGTTVSVVLPAESATARADAHVRWAMLYGGGMLLMMAGAALRAWRGEPVQADESLFLLFLLALFAAHLGASHRLRRRAGTAA